MKVSLLASLVLALCLPMAAWAQPESNRREKDASADRQPDNLDENGVDSMQTRRPGKKRQEGQANRRRQRQINPERLFQRFDQDQNGNVNAGELPERIRDRMMTGADGNRDGAIDKQEFQTYVQKAMQRRGQNQGARNDRNPMPQGPQGQRQGRRRQQGQRNGQPGLSFRDPENLDADKVLEKLDRDSSGDLQASELPKMMAAKLDRIDSNGDATVSRTELRSAIEKMKAKAMDAGKSRYGTDSDSSKGQIPKRPGGGD